MRVVALLVLLVLELAVFASVSGADMSSMSGILNYLELKFLDLVPGLAPVLVLSVGMTLVLVTAGIDLSVGSMLALVAAVMSLFDGGAAQRSTGGTTRRPADCGHAGNDDLLPWPVPTGDAGCRTGAVLRCAGVRMAGWVQWGPGNGGIGGRRRRLVLGSLAVASRVVAGGRQPGGRSLCGCTG